MSALLSLPELNAIAGLTAAEAAQRLREEGPNELSSSRHRKVWEIVVETVKQPMFLLLIACGAIYLMLGDRQEALMLLSFVFVIIAITLYQTRKTERALDALRDLSSPRALVIRDSQQVRIAGREVVRDDILLLGEGDRVAADARLLFCASLQVDESLLSGESVPVRKTQWQAGTSPSRPGGDGLPFVFAGTLITCGQGVSQVYATGPQTEMGRIGKSLQDVESPPSPLQQETDRVVRAVAVGGMLLCLLVMAAYGMLQGQWLKALLAGLTLAMALLPEEFPVVLTVFMALGAWRIARKNVLTRKASAVETLGSATVLCVDKTGTLTENRLAVRKLYADGSLFDDFQAELPERYHAMMEYALLACRPATSDPIEQSLRAMGERLLCGTEHLHQNWSMVAEYPLSPRLLAMSQVWSSRSGDTLVIAAKGAPEAIADLCHLEASALRELLSKVQQLSEEGLRLLGVARASLDTSKHGLPADQHDFVFEFLGLIGFEDPVRTGVADAIRDCRAAGIRVLMISGDYAGTAQHVARQIGLQNPERAISGDELAHMDDETLRERVRDTNIFARVLPQQKLRLVLALQANGEVVGMTGDGVNDAPALKAAHIGIALGGRGTDVAREASSLVVTDDDFGSIVEAVRLGRRIFDNLRKAFTYIFAIHIPIAGLSLLPVLLRWPLLLLPMHIVFLELIIDPACSVAFEAEPEERDVMRRPPRAAAERMINQTVLKLAFLGGACVLLICLAVFAVALLRGMGELDARTLSFSLLVLGNVALIWTNRSWSRGDSAAARSNAAAWCVTAAALGFLVLTLSLSSLREVFHFSVLHRDDVAVLFSLALCGLLLLECCKRMVLQDCPGTAPKR